MKIVLISVVLIIAGAGHAQTFVRYTIKDWVLANSFTNSSSVESYYTNGLSFCVPTNTIFKGTILRSGNANANIEALYRDTAERVSVNALTAGASELQTPVLGPATIYLDATLDIWIGLTEGTSTTPQTGTVVLIAEFDPVNVSPAIEGFAVQPANSSAAIGLETSTDLKTWQSTTPGSYGLTNAARFFRMNLTVTP